MTPVRVNMPSKASYCDADLYSPSIQQHKSSNSVHTTSTTEAQHLQQPTTEISATQAQDHGTVRRTSRVPKKPAWFTDYVSGVVQFNYKPPTQYPITNHITYDHLGHEFNAFMSTLDKQQDPCSFEQAVQA